MQFPVNFIIFMQIFTCSCIYMWLTQSYKSKQSKRVRGDRQNSWYFFQACFYVLATCVFGGKGNSRGNASVSVGEQWPPHSITEVSGFRPQSAFKRPQTETQKQERGLSAKYFTSFLHCHDTLYDDYLDGNSTYIKAI